MAQHAPPVDTASIVSFLSRTLPFSELDQPTIAEVAQRCTVDFYPQGERLLVRGETQLDSVLLIQKGGVRLSITDEQGGETLLDYRGEGSALGVLMAVESGVATMDAKTMEDTFFIRMPVDAFQRLLEERACIAQYFLRSFSRNYLSKAFSELQHRNKITLPTESGLHLFSTPVGQLASRDPASVGFGLTIQQAAAEMLRRRVGSLLIREPSGAVAGIVTDKDLRKTVALGLDHGAPLETIMTTPVETIDSGAVCFDALLKMMSLHIHHLAVTEQDQVSGIITSHDILVMQGKSPMSIFREIFTRRRIEDLYPLSSKVPQVVRTLVEEGAKAHNITRMITILNDLILEKLLDLLTRELGPSPVPFCWMLMGSEGRREQTFATDQDNALVYKDSDCPIIQRAARVYLEAFASRAIKHLVQCGFPPCPGDIMASNEHWRKPLQGWKDYFDHLIMVPEPEEVMHANIFFDFRPAWGEPGLVEELRDHVTVKAQSQDVFLRYLAASALEAKPPLTFFRSFIVEKNGEHKNRLDIKRRGLLPFMDFARVVALKFGIKETSTLGRLRRVTDQGLIPRDLGVDAAEAFEFLLQLRLIHQLEQVEQSQAPDNHIRPASLSELEKKTLKEAFGIVGRIQSFLKEMFRLQLA
jgi:CBS domain-containing protein